MRLTMAVDYHSLINNSTELFSEDAINRLFGEYAERHVSTVQWRVSALGKLLYHSNLGDRFTATPFTADNIPGFAAIHRPIYDKCAAIMAKIDPLEVAIRLARKHGLTLYPWLTIYDDAGYHPFTWSELIRNHPEYCWKEFNSDVYFHGITSYVYPEVVEHRLNQIRELLSYGIDGIHLCTRTHSRPPGYIEKYLDFLREHKANEWKSTDTACSLVAMYEQCRNRFGFDPPAVKAYQEKTGRTPEPDDLEWWKFRGGYLLDFLRQVRVLTKEKNGDLSFGVRADFSMYPKTFFDWKRMLDENIITELHYGASNGFLDAYGARQECPELFLSPGRKSYFRIVNPNVAVEEHIKLFEANGNSQFMERFDGITAFEAVHFVTHPELWDFITHLRNC